MGDEVGSWTAIRDGAVTGFLSSGTAKARTPEVLPIN